MTITRRQVSFVGDGCSGILRPPAGTATAGTAPAKLMAGTLNSIPEDGAIEYDGYNFYGTPAYYTTPTRKTFAFTDLSGITSPTFQLAQNTGVILANTGLNELSVRNAANDGYENIWAANAYFGNGDTSINPTIFANIGNRNSYVLYDITAQQWQLKNIDGYGPYTIGIQNPSGEPIGYENRTDSYMYFADAYRTFTIAPKSPASSFSFWFGQKKFTKTTPQSIQIQNTNGLHYMYFNSNGDLTESLTFPPFANALTGFVHWSTTLGANIGILDERHSMGRNIATHEFIHDTIGTRYQSGLTLVNLLAGTGAADTNAQISITEGKIHDEDIEISITRSATPTGFFDQELGLTTSVAGKFPIYYRLGAGTENWVKDTATNFPVRSFNGSAGQRIGYNLNTGGTWSIADPGGNGNRVAVWIYATNNQIEPVIAIMGQRSDATLQNAQNNNTLNTLVLGNFLTPECKILYRVIYRTSTGYANTIRAYVEDIQDLRAVSNIPSGTYVATDHSSLSGLTSANVHPATSISTDITYFNRTLSAADTTVQLALDTLDNHDHRGVVSATNTVIGYGALSVNASGTNNTTDGYQSLLSLSSGINNTAVGANSLSALTNQSGCTAIGASTLTANTAANQTAVGYGALEKNVDGALNTAVGILALNANTSGTNNVAVGDSALAKITTNSYCTAVGSGALSVNTAEYNTAIGYVAMQDNTTGTQNCAIGAYALADNIGGNYNFALGTAALRVSTSGDSNIAIGGYSLQTANGASCNIGIGAYALNKIVGNSNCVCVGDHSLYLTTGAGNTALGHTAGNVNTTGTYNTYLGYNANAKADAYNYAIAIGAGATVQGSNTVQIGGTGVDAVNVGIGLSSAPTARLHLPAGTATAGSAPVKLTAGTLLETLEDGAIEYDGTNFYFTGTGGAGAGIQSYSMFGTFSNMPTFGIPGRVYISNNSAVSMWIDNGTAWQPIINDVICTAPPVASAWTDYSSGNASVADSNGSLLYTGKNDGTNVYNRSLGFALSSATAYVEWIIDYEQPTWGAYGGYTIGMRESATKKLLCVSVNGGSQIELYNYADDSAARTATSGSITLPFTTPSHELTYGRMFGRMKRSGSNIIFEQSRNRVGWTQAWTGSTASYFTTAPDQVAIGQIGYNQQPIYRIIHLKYGSL